MATEMLKFRASRAWSSIYGSCSRWVSQTMSGPTSDGMPKSPTNADRCASIAVLRAFAGSTGKPGPAAKGGGAPSWPGAGP